MMKNSRLLIWLTLFSIAMGYLETAVVVYLRKIYYPAGFKFPLAPIEPSIALTELWREVATIIMLMGIAVLAGKNKLQKFVFFIYCFAIWDIFYYIFLKLLLDWPDSLLTWDILFLIPVPWIGPVLAPCIVSVTFIAFTITALKIQKRRPEVNLSRREKGLFILGGSTVVISFIYTYLNEAPLNEYPNAYLFESLKFYLPKNYNWGIFIIGELAIIGANIVFVKRNWIHFNN
jgi:hypothetical protein